MSDDAPGPCVGRVCVIFPTFRKSAGSGEEVMQRREAKCKCRYGKDYAKRRGTWNEKE